MGRIILVRRNPIRMGNCIYWLCTGGWRERRRRGGGGGDVGAEERKRDESLNQEHAALGVSPDEGRGTHSVTAMKCKVKDG